MVILPKESRVVSEEEDDNNETMAEAEEAYYEVVWVDEGDKPTGDLRYNG